MHSIVGASVSSNAMDAQARAAWLVRRGLNDVDYVIIRYHTKYNKCTCMYGNMSLLSIFEYSFGTCLSRLQRTHSVECERS